MESVGNVVQIFVKQLNSPLFQNSLPQQMFLAKNMWQKFYSILYVMI